VRGLVAALVVAGCSADVCDGVAGSCIALEVRGDVSVDQLRITSPELHLDHAPSPKTPRAQPVRLPVQLAVLPGPFAGSYTLTVDGELQSQTVATVTGANVIQQGTHESLTLTLQSLVGDAGVPDGASADLAGVDLAGRDFAGVDLSGTADLAFVHFDLSGDLGHVWVYENYNGPGLFGVWAPSRSDVYAVGGGFDIMVSRSAGNGEWSASELGGGSVASTVTGVSSADVYVGGFGFIEHKHNGAWANELFYNGQVISLFPLDGGVIGGSGNEIDDGGTGRPRVFLSAPGAFSVHDSPVPSSVLGGGWASDSANVYLGVPSGVAHTNQGLLGSYDIEEPVSGTILAVWGSSPTDVYAVGNRGIAHSGGGGLPASWTAQVTRSDIDFQSVSGSSASNVYAAGNLNGAPDDAGVIPTTGVMFHSRGDGTWQPEPIPPMNRLYGVWVNPPDDAYAVGIGPDGTHGMVIHKR
jgi:hypothetical protein